MKMDLVPSRQFCLTLIISNFKKGLPYDKHVKDLFDGLDKVYIPEIERQLKLAGMSLKDLHLQNPKYPESRTAGLRKGNSEGIKGGKWLHLVEDEEFIHPEKSVDEDGNEIVIKAEETARYKDLVSKGWTSGRAYKKRNRKRGNPKSIAESERKAEEANRLATEAWENRNRK